MNYYSVKYVILGFLDEYSFTFHLILCNIHNFNKTTACTSIYTRNQAFEIFVRNDILLMCET